MIKTRFTELFGITSPIVQGGMQHLGIPKFASLISNAGGMGTINITCYSSPEEFHEAVREMNALTQKPYIVNISLVPDLTKGDEIFKYIEICAKEKVAAIETAGGDPSQFIPAIKENGIKLIHKTPSAKIAIRMEEKGADVITIAGYEVAGHQAPTGSAHLLSPIKWRRYAVFRCWQPGASPTAEAWRHPWPWARRGSWWVHALSPPPNARSRITIRHGSCLTPSGIPH